MVADLVIVPVPRVDGSVVEIRFPPDADWIERQKLRKLIVRRGTTTVSPSAEFDLALLRRLAVCSLPAGLSEPEASSLVNQLALAEAEGVERLEGDVYRVRLRIAGNVQTQHDLRIRDLASVAAEYYRGFTRVVRFSAFYQHVHVVPTLPARIYEATVLKGPPFCSIVHKVGVIASVVERMAAQ